MLSARRQRRTSQLVAAALAAAAVPVLTLASILAAPTAAAAGVCGTPGGSGAGGTLTGVVNTYYPGTGTAAAGATSISVGAGVGAGTPVAAGDLLLVIQMQAATIDSTNTNSYGHGGASVAPASGYTALNGSGLYEYVLATSSVVAGSVSVAGLGPGAGLVNTYTRAPATVTSGQMTFQVIRVPQYTTATTSSSLTALGWNGSVGGVLALDTSSTLTLNGTVSVDGLGFRGGAGIQKAGGAAGLANTDVAVSTTLGAHGEKAEGIAGSPVGTTVSDGYPGGDVARGAPGNAGGGGTDGRPSNNDQNSGGGGGGNGGAGGVGGNTWSSNLSLGGYGGVALPATSARVFLGGGGGAGTSNNFTSPAASGAAGGGIVLVRAGAIAGAGAVTANGAAAYNLTANDGGGGGGGGGTIILTSPSGSLTGATLSADGGRGGNAWATQAGAGNQHGPGGGGGGGWILTSTAPTARTVALGTHGVTTTGLTAYGSTDGTAGQTATVTPASIPGVSGGAECADLSITKTGPATVNASGSVTYTLAVANAGPASSSGLSVVDTLPAGVTFVSATGTGWTCSNSGNVSVTCSLPALASGAGAATIAVVVTAPVQASTLSNTATVTATTPDPVPANNTSTISTTVTPLADLSIVKSGPASVAAGGSVNYTLAVANAGPSDAALVSVSDTLPTGVTFGSATGTGWTCTNVGNVSVACTRPALATGTSAPTITVNVTAPVLGATLSNVASVSSTTTDPNPANNSSTVSTTLTPSADLAITKTGPASVTASGSVSYSLLVVNNGPSDAANVSVADTLPAGITFVSASGAGWACTNVGNVSVTCTRAALVAGASAPLITVNVTAPAQAASLSNTASVSSTTSDPNPANNTSVAVTTVNAAADLAITKSGPATVVAGANVTYTLGVTNNGPSDAAAVSVTDTLPAGVTFVSASGIGWACSNTGNVSATCTRATLAAGAVAPGVAVVVKAPGQAASMTDTASVSATTADPNSADNTASVTTAVSASADLAITKTGPGTVTAGGTVTYSLVVVNNGPSDAAAVSVSDTLPVAVTFVSAVGPGWVCTNTGNVSVGCTRAVLVTGVTAPTITVVVTAPAQAGTLSNTASVSSTTADPNVANNTSSTSTGVTASADLSLVKSGPATQVAGLNISYQLVVTDNGPSDAANLSVIDSLPAGVSFVSATGPGWACANTANISVTCTAPGLATGASAPTITVVVTSPSQPGTLNNAATVSALTPDPNPSDNTSTTSTVLTAMADLNLVKTAPATVMADANVSYTLDINNFGPSESTGISVIDTLPPGVTFVSAVGTGWACTNTGNISVTCTLPVLATASAAATITVVVTAPPQGTTLTNTATVSSTSTDPFPANNTDTAATTVTASADLSVVKTGPANVSAHATISYALAVANSGPSDAAAVSVTDTLPAGVTFVSAVGTGWICTNAANVSVTCTRPTLTTSTAAPPVAVVVTAPSAAATLTNAASVSSATNDPNLANNVSVLVTSVGAAADLSVLKTGPPTIAADGSITYQLVVANSGPSTAAAVSVTDTLPAGVTFVSAAGTGWTCTNTANVSVDCAVPSLTSGTTAPTITVVVTAPSQALSLTNTVSVASTTNDPNPANNTSSVTTTVTGVADLSLVKAGPASVVAGANLAYTLIVNNSGPSDAASVSVTDTLPAGVTFVSAAGTGWVCTPTGNVSVSCARPTLASGATGPTLTIVVTAPGQGGIVSNTASVTSTTFDPVPTNNTSTVSTTVTASADLFLIKTGPATVVAGMGVSYALVVTNNGPSDAAAVSVTDTLPAGAFFVSAAGAGWLCSNTGNISVLCTRAALAAGASAPAIVVLVTAPGQAGTLTNTAAVSSVTVDPVPANNTSTAVTTVTAAADLAITKTGPANVLVDGSVAYTLVVTNSGPSDASAISVVDTLPAGVAFVSASGPGWTCTHTGNTSVTCTRAVLASGSVAGSISVVVTAPVAPTTMSNSAQVSSATADPNPSNDTATATTVVVTSADLSIVKTGSANVLVGGAVTYQLVVANAGPSDAASVTVTDVLPPGVAFVSATGAGWTCANTGNVSVSCTVPSVVSGSTAALITVVVNAPGTAVTLTNAATVSSVTADPNPANNTSSASTNVGPAADLSVVKTGPANVTVGAPISYALAVGNAGPSDAVGVSVTDSLPAGVTFVSASGAGWTCTHAGNVSVTCTVPTLASGTAAPTIVVVVTAPNASTTLSDTAIVSSTTVDPVPANNTSTASTTVGLSADVSVTKTGPASVAPGGSVTYHLAVSNAGPSAASAVSLTDALPSGVTFVSATGTGWVCTHVGNVSVTCTVATLASSTAAAVITMVVTAPLHAALLSNSAAVSSSTPDPDPANNSSTVSTAVGAVADLSLVKTGPKEATVSSDIAYHLVVSNAGPDAASKVTVTDTLPVGVTFVSASGAGWTCTHSGNTVVTCTRGSLASGSVTPTITLVVKAPATATTLANHANVTSTTFDPAPNNNSAAAPTSVLAAAISAGGGGALPHTGADGVLAGPLGALVLLIGVGLVLAARRRSG